MKKNMINSGLLCLLVFSTFHTTAQSIMTPGPSISIPKPKVWYSFDRSGDQALYADIGNTKCLRYSPSSAAYIPGRPGAGINSTAVSFDSVLPKFGGLLTSDMQGHVYDVKLFGVTDASLSTVTPIPPNFTISCWVYVDPSDTAHTRKIFFTDNTKSRFALLHKGPNIYLRRIATYDRNHAFAINRFDYLMGAPASFDAGEGWYHVILVMGERPDKAKYTKLFIGKPGWVRYDGSGPRVVSTSSTGPLPDSPDRLASNFGGAYAFTGKQSFMDDESLGWGLGNIDGDDDVHHATIAPVRAIDDFAVWDTTFTEAQAFELFKCQKVNPANSCWVNYTIRKMDSTIVEKQQPLVGKEPQEIAAISVFPNPTTGDLWVKIPADETGGNASIMIADMSGRILYTRTVVLAKTGQSVQLNMKTITKASGIYLLQVAGPSQAKSFKIVVQ